MILGSKIRLRGKKLADTQDDYKWQTDPELARLDAVRPLSSTFSEYLSGFVHELRNSSPIRHPFAIETLDGRHIGNCVYYGGDGTKDEAELGIMIGDRDYRDKGYGTDVVTTLVGYIFRETGLKRIYLKTLEDNYRAQQCFKKCGFTPCGNMVRDRYRFVLMEMYLEQWQERQKEA